MTTSYGLFMIAVALSSGIALVSGSEKSPVDPIERKKGPMLRIICAAGIEKEQTFVLASRDEEENWKEFGSVSLRPSFISDWQPVAPGRIHLTVREGERLVSKGSIVMPTGAGQAIAILFPGKEPGQIRGDVIVPEKLSFRKGSTLVVNYSRVDAAVALGSNKAGARPGSRVVVSPGAGDDNMFRKLVAYKDRSGKNVICYDRYVPFSPDSRDLMLLLPDSILGLRVVSFAEFGPFK